MATPSASDPVAPAPAGDEDRTWRRVLWKIPTGLFVIGTCAGDRRNLMTASWLTQVATEPRHIGVGLEAESLTVELALEARAFSVSLLEVADRALVRRFARPVGPDEVALTDEGAGVGTIRDVAVHAEVTGAPILDGAAAWLDCRVRHVLELGSHRFVVGLVVGAGFGPNGEPDRVLEMGDTRMHYGG